MERLVMTLTRNFLTTGLSALALGGALLLASAPAQAGASTGTWRNGMQAGPYGVGCYDARCASRNYGYRRAYRPVQAYPSYRSRRAYDDCYTERRRSVNRWGEVTVRRVRVCS
jgi:hypothetical protein